MEIASILEDPKVYKYLKKRGLLSQYKKAKGKLLSGDFRSVDFKLRKPQKKGRYQFRINKQYRAYGCFDGETFKVFTISDHQDV